MDAVKIIRLFLLLWGFSLCTCGVQQSNDRNPVIPLEEYTAENSDRWEMVEDSHIPHVMITRGNPDTIKIWIESFEWKPDHYIEKIGIMDEQKRDINELVFPKTKVLDISAVFPLPTDWKNRKLKAYSKCSLHDLWTAPVK